MGCLQAVLVLTGRVYAVPVVHLTANLGFITQEAEVPREAGLSTAFHTPGAPRGPAPSSSVQEPDVLPNWKIVLH